MTQPTPALVPQHERRLLAARSIGLFPPPGRRHQRRVWSSPHWGELEGGRVSAGSFRVYQIAKSCIRALYQWIFSLKQSP